MDRQPNDRLGRRYPQSIEYRRQVLRGRAESDTYSNGDGNGNSDTDGNGNSDAYSDGHAAACADAEAASDVAAAAHPPATPHPTADAYGLAAPNSGAAALSVKMTSDE